MVGVDRCNRPCDHHTWVGAVSVRMCIRVLTGKGVRMRGGECMGLLVSEERVKVTCTWECPVRVEGLCESELFGTDVTCETVCVGGIRRIQTYV